MRTRLAIVISLALVAAGCSLYNHHQASQPDTVRRTEAMLAQAGFGTIAIDATEKSGMAAQLTPYELRRYDATAGAVYWYYDPDLCACVYEGHQPEFDRYQMLVRQEHDLAQYAAESQEADVTSLNALNPLMFPVPIWWWASPGPFPGPSPRPHPPILPRPHLHKAGNAPSGKGPTASSSGSTGGSVSSPTGGGGNDGGHGGGSGGFGGGGHGGFGGGGHGGGHG